MRLNAEALYAGDKHCPVCGGQKTKKAYTCIDCYRKHGLAARDAIIAYRDAVDKANAAYSVDRKNLTVPVLAKIKISKDAKFIAGRNGTPDHVRFIRTVDGGVVNVYVFGANESNIGSIITGVVQLRSRVSGSCEIPYVRIELVDGVESSVKVGLPSISGNVASLPIEQVDVEISHQRDLGFRFGFYHC